MTAPSHPPATRAEAFARLEAFLPRAGRDYARLRNYDLPQDGHPHVSRLSPHLRHRLITEPEVLGAVLARHGATEADKFIQEVCWRSYWKGWLEIRPAVWSGYRSDLDRALAAVADDPALAARLDAAESGQTGIDAFNAWARELVETGYLHNHARMWFASIWIFTLRLPWQIGADFFLRHLLDGDPASNTLGWRWVAGLQTPGKHYLARSANISKYTRGRHDPEWRLNSQAAALGSPSAPGRRAAPTGDSLDPALGTGLLLTEEDLSPGFALDALGAPPIGCAALICVADRSPRGVSPSVRGFTAAAVADCTARHAGRLGAPGPVSERLDAIVDWARDLGLEQVATPYAPVGPARSRLTALDKALAVHDISLVRLLRDWDRDAWPHATHGFFRFRRAIPRLLDGLGR